MEEEHPDLSVIVASYNVAPYLRACLQSLKQAGRELRMEVLVVDNRSRDGSPEMVSREFPSVTLVRNKSNLGFSKANNLALKMSSSRYVLLLNPDTLVPPGTLPSMVQFLDQHPDVGMAGCRLERADGRLDAACKRGFPTPWNSLTHFLQLDRLFPGSRLLGGYRRTWQDPAGRYEVDSIVGAFMLCRRRALEEVGGLDEDYFMFGEDLDWCFRLKSRDWRVYYLGDRKIIHHKGAAAGQEPQRMNFHFHRSMLLFHRKHLEGRYPFFINWLVYSGIGLRFAFKSMLAALRPVRRRRQPPAAGQPRMAARGAGAVEQAGEQG